MRSNDPKGLSPLTLLAEIDYIEMIASHAVKLVGLIKTKPAAVQGLSEEFKQAALSLDSEPYRRLEELNAELYVRLGLTEDDLNWRPIMICAVCQYGSRPEESEQVSICPECEDDFCPEHLPAHICIT